MLFVGINPGVRSALTGHHFAGFSNRFWKLLYQSGLVPEPVTYLDDDRLPEWGYGITNIVARATPGIDELRPEEYAAGRLRLRAKVRRYQPKVVAFIGITVYRAMFPERKGPVAMGVQDERLGKARGIRASEHEWPERTLLARRNARGVHGAPHVSRPGIIRVSGRPD